MKLVTILGARPQFIKAAAVNRALNAGRGDREVLVHTGQHYDDNMSEVFFRELGIPKPSYHLGIGSGPHGAQTGAMLKAIEEVLQTERPNWVLVYGDTNSTLAGALAAAKLHFPVAHVEAGLRSFNRRMPEEINRVMTDHISTLLFTPTKTADENLAREGIRSDQIKLVGDVMYDVALMAARKADETSTVLTQLKLQPKQYVLATIHRAENTDEPKRLRAILEGLAGISSEIAVVLPLHPRTRAVLARLEPKLSLPPTLRIVDPVGYLDMVMLEKNAAAIATDSGGIQKEAFFYRVPCVTLRDETEWVELVELGWNRVLPPTSSESVYEGVLKALTSRGTEGAPYGSGSAAESILNHLRG